MSARGVEPRPGTARALISSSRARTATLKRLAGVTSQMTTASVAAMERQLPWFAELDADHRSWIMIVARAGIDGFVRWFADDKDVRPSDIFDAAPPEVARRITLEQTVALVRTTIDTVEEQIQLLPRGDRVPLQTAIVHYSREVAFAAAEVYARAAEVRGAWDARLEAMVVDAVVRAEADESVTSRASTLGWRSGTQVTVAIGGAPAPGEPTLEALRRHGASLKLDVLVAVQGERLVCVIGGPGVTDPIGTCEQVAKLAEHFGPGPIVVGPLVADLMDAAASARAATSGYRAAKAWPEGPRTMLSTDLLPERALAGDGHARRTLSTDIFGALAGAGGDLLETCVAFLDNGGSIEASARQLFVHSNTVRYRSKRIQEVTGFNPADPRDAYVLRLAITLGRLQR